MRSSRDISHCYMVEFMAIKVRIMSWKRSCFSTALLLLFRARRRSHIHSFGENMKILLYMKGAMHGSLGLIRLAIIPTCC